MNRAWRAWLGAATLLAALVGAQTVAQAQAKSSFEVTIKGFKGTEGQALITVYSTEDSWLEVPKAVQTIKRPIKGGTLTVKIEGLPAGTYGVSVIHDANKNDELDMRWFPFPKPKEGAGASRNPKAKMGPPKWEDAKVDLNAGESKKLVINMTYW